MQSSKKKNQSGFTLLELLVVVAILAILGGALIAAYDGLESQAAKGTATGTIAAVDNAVRSFVVTERSLPNGLETLLAGDPTSLDTSVPPVTDGQGITVVDAQGATGTFIANLGSNIVSKLSAVPLTAAQLSALQNGGITIGRYVHNDGNDDIGTAGVTLDIIENGAGVVGDAGVGPISDISIPTHTFEAPRPGLTRNRGRGYPKLLAVGDEVAMWNGTTSDVNGDGSAPFGDGYNNIKVNASPDDVLIAFGIGNASSLVGVDNEDGSGGVGNVRLANAPYYGDVNRNDYSHYIMLVNVGPLGSEFEEAKLAAVIDARGDFLDEEFAEATGQKQ